MATKLWELWIIDKAGLSLVHIQSLETQGKQSVSPVLFSGIITAVETLAAESIDAIKMNDSKILIVPVNSPIKFFVVGRARIKDKDDNIRKILYKIRDSFTAEFTEILPSWGGDQTIFTYFTDNMQKIYFV